MQAKKRKAAQLEDPHVSSIETVAESFLALEDGLINNLLRQQKAEERLAAQKHAEADKIKVLSLKAKNTCNIRRLVMS